MSYNIHQKPIISDTWRIRNDTDYLVLYECTANASFYKILSPIEASIIPFFNGKHTYEEIIKIFYELYSYTKSDNTKLFDLINTIILDLLSIDGLLSTDNIGSPIFKKDNEYFLAKYKNYKYPITRLNRPLSLNIAFTNRCKFDCIYCYAERELCEEVSLDKWLQFFNYLTDNEIFLVDIGGADIFSRKDAIQIIREMIKRDFAFMISTKSMITENMAYELAELNVGKDIHPGQIYRPLQISFDTTDEQMSTSFVRYPKQLKNITQTIKNLRKVGIRPRIKCVLTPFNINEPEKIIEYFMPFGITEFFFAQYSRSHYNHDDKLFLSYENKLALKQKSKELKSKYPNITIDIEDKLSMGGKRNLTVAQWNERNVCSGGRKHCFIKPNGNVILCEQIPHNEKSIVGNIFVDDLTKIWHSKKLLSFLYPSRELFKDSTCYTCPDYETCHNEKGYCYRDSLFSYGTLYDAQPECPRQYKIPLRGI